MQNDDDNLPAKALNTIIDVLSRLDESSRARVLNSVSTFFHLPTELEYRAAPSARPDTAAPPQSSRPSFSDDFVPTPKQFLFEKQPQTDIERIACLAYYLTNYRDTPHFKTLDLAKLNTEAAQPKFSNTAYAANNAVNRGFLVTAAKTLRQLTASGEQYVMALPDRAAAKVAMNASRRKPTRKKRAE